MLGYDQYHLNTKHSVPFPVISTPRLVGRNKLDNLIYEVWAFDSMFPEEVCTEGCKEEKIDVGDGDDSDSEDEDDDDDGGSGKPPVRIIVAVVLGGASAIVIGTWILHRIKRRRVGQKKEDTVETASVGNDHGVAALQLRRNSVEHVPLPTYEEATKV